MRIDNVVTSGLFKLDGGEWEVDNNVWIVGDDSEVYIIDAAHNAEAIAEAVGNRRVKGILATHGHSDHIDAAPELSRLVDAPVYLHPTDGFLWQRQNPGAHYRQLLDGATFTVAGTDLRVMSTPGHSPGCVVLHVGETLLSGDTLFNGGPGATGRKYSDFDVIIESLKNVVFTLPEDTKVLPGHGDATTVGAEAARIDEYIERGY